MSAQRPSRPGEPANRRPRPQVADRRGSEAARHDREARARAILDTAADAIITVDEAGRIESFNPAAESMFDCSAAEVIGEAITALIPGWDRDEFPGAPDAGGTPVPGVHREVLGRAPRAGRTFPIELAVSEFRLAGRKISTLIARGVSRRRALESRMLEASTREQQRIGGDLHDRVGQELTGLGYLAAGLTQQLDSQPQAEICRRITDGLGRLVGEVRGAIRGLSPVPKDPHGLASALAGLAERLEEDLGTACRFVCEGAVPIDDHGVATYLYLLARESARSSVQHAHARNIEIRLRGDGDRITLEVVDDGVGTGPEPCVFPILGLQVLRYRAGPAVEGGDRTGTRLTCTRPRPGGDRHG
jgi:PAS domain S-box-containing protein